MKAYVGNGLTLKTLNLIYIAGDTPDVPQILFESAKNLIEIGVGERNPDSCITRHILKRLLNLVLKMKLLLSSGSFFKHPKT